MVKEEAYKEQNKNIETSETHSGVRDKRKEKKTNEYWDSYIKARKSYAVTVKRYLYERVDMANSCFSLMTRYHFYVLQVKVSNPIFVAEQVTHSTQKKLVMAASKNYFTHEG